MTPGQDDQLYDQINITPMLDVAYVLLLIFIIMTTAAVQGIVVQLPKASATPTLSKPETRAITLTQDGRLFLDAYPVTLPELETRLAQYKASVPDLPVLVRADMTVQYRNLVEVLEVLNRLEIRRLGLVTDSPSRDHAR